MPGEESVGGWGAWVGLTWKAALAEKFAKKYECAFWRFRRDFIELRMSLELPQGFRPRAENRPSHVRNR